MDTKIWVAGYSQQGQENYDKIFRQLPRSQDISTNVIEDIFTYINIEVEPKHA